MRDRVTTSMRPLSGTVTISLLHDVSDVTASALTVTFMTPNNDHKPMYKDQLSTYN